MDLDFYEIYRDWPTTELLKIVQRPNGYQPEAVEAATRRLSERETSPEDLAAAQAFYEEVDRIANLKAEKIDRLKEQAADLLQPVIQPGTSIDPRKWLNLFLLVLGVNYAWTLIQTLIAVYKYPHLDFTFLINIITIFYLPLFFYLLYKRKRWGWILVFAEVLIDILGVPVQVYAYSSYLRAFGVGHMQATTMSWFAIQTILKAAFGWFLWRQDVCDLFGVGRSTRTRTVVYTSVFSLLAFGAFWLFS